MTDKKKILTVGIDPKLIDFTLPEFANFPGLTAEKVEMGIKGSVQKLADMGHLSELCWTDFGDTAIDVLRAHLQKEKFDCVLIGAGIRVPEKNFFLFEKMINEVIQQAPQAKICFNTNPGDSLAAVQRWI